MTDQLAVHRLPVDQLQLDPANVRQHGDRNLEAIKVSLARFGQQKPIVVRADGTVVAGNGTLQAAKELGWDAVNVVITGLRGAELAAYAIADNRTAELAEWDLRGLAAALAAMDDGQRAATGWSAAEIETLGAADWSPATPGDMPTWSGHPSGAVTVKFTAEQWARIEPVLGNSEPSERILELLERHGALS